MCQLTEKIWTPCKLQISHKEHVIIDRQIRGKIDSEVHTTNYKIQWSLTDRSKQNWSPSI
jgi:hypothetical protein